MVDSIISIKGGKHPSLLASYTVKENEPEYPGNGSGAHWPAVYVIEGLGQCCNLLILISAVEKELLKAGFTFTAMDEVLKRLADDEPDEITAILRTILDQRRTEIYSSVGFLGSADVEITGHVRPGGVVSYEVMQNQAFGSLVHSTVRAFGGKDLIARGTLVSAGRND